MTQLIRRAKELSEIEKSYLAGFFDGEGCISITRQKTGKSISLSYNLRVSLVQSQERGKVFLEYWLERVGVGCIHPHIRNSEKEHICYAWIISSNEALSFLQMLMPYLRLKKQEAELAIEFQSTKEPSSMGRPYGHGYGGLSQDILNHREEMYQQLSAMKGALSRRGRKPITS